MSRVARSSPKTETDKQEHLKARGPVVRRSHGRAKCLHCHRVFDRRLFSKKFCSEKCRVTHWHLKNRRVTPLGRTVEVDGRAVDFPAIDTDLEREMYERMIKESEERLAQLKREAELHMARISAAESASK